MFNVEDYTFIAEWFPRMLGAIYFFTFVAFAIQIRGLLGENGILPVAPFLNYIKRRYPNSMYVVPTIFWWNSSNRALVAVCLIGTGLSIALLMGIAPPLMLILLYILYLSIVSAGQEFLGFGWEGFLLEITINACLLSLTVIPNIFVWLSLNFLLFRFHVQAGAVKLQSHDPNWRNLTAIAYHYQTQPLPNTIAWYFYRLPLWFHKICAGMMFFIELVVPFGIFFGEDVRLLAFMGLFGLQFFIWFTGNLSFLNHLTALFCFILINNQTFELLGAVPPALQVTPFWLEAALSICGAILLALQVARFYHHFLPIAFFAKIFRYIDPFHLINRYGIFAVMTTRRIEIIIEGSEDGVEWKEYTFWFKPSEVNKRPMRVSPYQPRLDWQVWFLPFSRFESERWFHEFLLHLLKGTKDVTGLLNENPFPNEPPKYVRALAYDYVFTTAAEKRGSGDWWVRTYVGPYSPTLSLKAH